MPIATWRGARPRGPLSSCREGHSIRIIPPWVAYDPGWEVRVAKIGNIMVTTVSLVWMAWAGWNQFANLPEGAVENHSSEAVKERLRDCSGTFKQRYECKNAVVIDTDRTSFFNMLGRIAIVVVPPMLLAAGVHMMRRRSDDSPDDDLLGQSHGRRHRRRSSGHH
jgi:hypothetical protein